MATLRRKNWKKYLDRQLILKIQLLAVSFLGCISPLLAQQKIEISYLDKNKSRCDSVSAVYILKKATTDSLLNLSYKELYKGDLDHKIYYIEYKGRRKHGLRQDFFEDGKLQIESNYKDGNLEGVLKSYYDNELLRREEFYSKGSLISGKCFGVSGRDTSYYPHRIKAEFPGGTNALMSYISKNLVYPEIAREMGIEGRVYIAFNIDEKGNSKDHRVLRPVHPALDAAALKVIKAMPAWSPAELEGKKTESTFTVPILFKLR